jgi:2-aminoadipate transaminase
MKNVDHLLAGRSASNGADFVRAIFAEARKPGVISLSGGLPNPRFFPVEALIASTAKVMRSHGTEILQYGTSDGFLPLREWIAGRYKQQGIDVSPDMVVLMSGSLQGLDITGRIFLEPGDEVVIEAPMFLGAIQTLANYQPRFVPVPMGDEGIDTDALARTLQSHPNAKLIEVNPSAQNPSGVTYSAGVRAQFAAAVKNHQALIVEDDPYAELRFDGTRPISLRRELGDRVIGLGSFSKIISPGMRVGWVVAAREVAARFTLGKQMVDSHASNFASATIWQFIQDNDIDAHIAGINAIYTIQRDAMLAACKKYFPPDVRYTHPQGGMFVWVTMPEGADALTLFRDAVATEKVAVVPGAPFYTDGVGGKTQFRMSFSTVEPAMIDEGVQRLARAMLRHLDGA